MKQFTRIEPTDIIEAGSKYKRTLVVKRFQTDDGLTHEFTTFGRDGASAAAVIALTPDNQVVTIYQFRPGPERWLYDIPGGGVNPGEDPLKGVQRELLEETGYISDDVTYRGEYWDAYKNYPHRFYLARNCRLAPGSTGPGDEEAEQGAEVRLISIATLLDNARSGQMTDPAAVLMAYDELVNLKGEK